LLGHQEKFDVNYKQELAVLKEEHAKEVAQLKNDYETQLKSLEKKYNQEGVMAAETGREVWLVTL
jgi:hypothetical protein